MKMVKKLKRNKIIDYMNNEKFIAFINYLSLALSIIALTVSLMSLYSVKAQEGSVPQNPLFLNTDNEQLFNSKYSSEYYKTDPNDDQIELKERHNKHNMIINYINFMKDDASYYIN